MWFNIKMIDTLLRIYQPALYSQVETKLNMLPKCERSFDQSDYMKKLIRLYRSGQQIFQGDSFYVHLKPILPFCYYPELIVSLNASDLAPDEPIKLQRKAYERKNLYVVVCETFNCFSDMEYTIPAGLHVKRLACLRDLGFKVIVVEHADWVRFNRTQQMEQKWNELRSMIAKQNHESV